MHSFFNTDWAEHEMLRVRLLLRVEFTAPCTAWDIESLLLRLREAHSLTKEEVKEEDSHEGKE